MSVGDQMYDGMPIDEPEETTPASLRVRAYILRYQPTPDEESAKSLDIHADAWAAREVRLAALETAALETVLDVDTEQGGEDGTPNASWPTLMRIRTRLAVLIAKPLDLSHLAALAPQGETGGDDA